MNETEFIKHLQNEKLKTQDSVKFRRQKVRNYSYHRKAE